MLKDWFKNWEIEKKINIVEIIALVIAISAFAISYYGTFGQSKISVDYSAGDRADFYFFNESSIVFEFVVVNNGFGGTIYEVEPLACQFLETCLPEEVNPVVKIKYNEEKEFTQIFHADLKPIQAKSAELVQVVVENISIDEIPESVQLMVRDVRNNDHVWKTFRKAPFSF